MSSRSENSSGANYFLTGGEEPARLEIKEGFVLNGRYSLGKLLGTGGMGEVYLAQDMLTKQNCALKWIRQHLAKEESSRQRFIDELTITQRLSHPGIVRTHALQLDAAHDVLFYTMEWIDGQTLEDILTESAEKKQTPPIALDSSLKWLTELAEILDYAHRQGVLHRDLKPANIMVDSSQRLRLTDFGIARTLEAHTAFHTGFVGTPVFMSPEQLRGGVASTASDMYSLGVVAYQMLTGRLPHGRFRTPKEWVPEIPVHLDELVLQCLESEPAERLSSASEFLEVLSGKALTVSGDKASKESLELASDGFPMEVFSERRECFQCAEKVMRKARHCKECGVAFPDSALQRAWVEHMEKEAQRLACNLSDVLETLEEERFEQLESLWRDQLQKEDSEDAGRAWWFEFFDDFRLPTSRQRLTERAEKAANDVWQSVHRRKKAAEKKKLEQLEAEWKQQDLLRHSVKSAARWWEEKRESFELHDVQSLVEEHASDAMYEVQKAHLQKKAGDKQQLDSLPEATLVFCPPGSFQMGSREDDPDSWEDERPQRLVTLNYGFWMLSTPVTQGMYEALMERNPSYYVIEEGGFLGFGATRITKPDSPVENLSWWDAIVFCNALSVQEGLEEAYVLNGVFNAEWKGYACPGYRLPTEAEWEYACRYGSEDALYGELNDIAWYNHNSGASTQTVGTRQANPLGLYDMIGNVWEWCFDGYASDAYQTLSDIDPVFFQSNEKIRRGGGCWSMFDTSYRASYRGRMEYTNCQSNTGFRIVRTHLPD